MTEAAIKLIVTDIDNTLVQRHTHQATDTVIDAIKTLQRNNIHVAAATARPIGYVADLLRVSGLHGPQVIDGGATIYDLDTDAVLWQRWLDVERLRSIVRVLLPFTAEVDYFPDMKIVPTAEVVIENIVESAPYVFARAVAANRVAQIRALLADVSDIDCAIVDGQDGVSDIQICDVRATKEHGVMQLQQLLGVLPETTLAIGDGENDLALFRVADTRVAMGNASELLKDQATHITSTVHEDGWARAMENLRLVG